MDRMFEDAIVFSHALCGIAFINSQATRDSIFKNCPGSISESTCERTKFSPQYTTDLQNAVEKCLKYSPQGDCSDGPHGHMRQWDISRMRDLSSIFMGQASFNGDISKWDVSRVTDMKRMFMYTNSFNSDISTYDTSSVKDMSSMFSYSTSFNGDITHWDVSSVTDMHSMFMSALSFNRDISHWDVSSVDNMDNMFMGARLFNHQLCGAAFINSRASKDYIFKNSRGSISESTCKRTQYSPEYKNELQNAVDTCLTYSPRGYCADGPQKLIMREWDISRMRDLSSIFMGKESFNGDISKWDVSYVTDMNRMFMSTKSFNSDISIWDTSSVRDMSDMFAYSTSFNGDISHWDVSRVTDMHSMFMSARSFNRDISHWDVSSVTNMDTMFREARSFNHKLCGAAFIETRASRDFIFQDSPGSISSSICEDTKYSPQQNTELQSAVERCLTNSPKGDCTDGAHGPIRKWDISRMLDLSSIFTNKASFNGDISKWDVSRVTDMNRMFMYTKSFDGDISTYDTSSVKDMSSMFSYATKFNCDITYWDVSSVTDMHSMFMSATSFNRDISHWDVSNVEKMDTMFMDARSFNHKLCGIAFTNTRASIDSMFKNCPGSISSTKCERTKYSPEHNYELQDAVDKCLASSPKGDCPDGPHGYIREWDISKMRDLSTIFMGESSFDGDISKWDVSHVTDMSRMFMSTKSFNGDISTWDMSSTKDLSSMFSYCTIFNGDISNWDVTSVENMHGMFSVATSFNSDISKWRVSSVTNMHGMFLRASSFNIDISDWDVSNVINMDEMFKNAESFNQKLCGAAWIENTRASRRSIFDQSRGSILTTTCKNTNFAPPSTTELQSAIDSCLEGSPQGACSYDSHGPMGKWDVSRLSDLSSVLMGETSFNGDISKWDVSKARDMAKMFLAAAAFNGDISKWDVSRVTHMDKMFKDAKRFNGDISKWVVSSAEDTSSMFENAESFDRDLSRWDVSGVMKMDSMFSKAKSFKQQLCGEAWVRSIATRERIFADSPGSISLEICHGSEPQRWLAGWQAKEPAKSDTSAKKACSKCGRFTKSGKASCCAPGGAWYQKCGGNGNSKFEYNWKDGVDACKLTATTTVDASGCLTCGMIQKSGKLSCCARGGSWFGNCAATANAKVQHTWYEGIQACKGRKSKTVVLAQQQRNASSGDAGNFTNSTKIFASETTPSNAHAKTSVKAQDIPVDEPIIPPTNVEIAVPQAEASADIAVHQSGSSSIIAGEFGNLWGVFVHAGMLLIIAVY